MERKFNEFIELGKSYISLKHELGGVDTLAASWSPTQEVAGLNAFDDKYKTFRENSNVTKYVLKLKQHYSLIQVDIYKVYPQM